MNDDNLVIIRNAPGLAAEYAVNILGVYGHYKWLYNAWLKASAAAPAPKKGTKTAPVPVAPTYDGNVDSDQWQTWESTGANLQQLQFMMGIPLTARSVPPPSVSRTAREATIKIAKTATNKATVLKNTPKEAGRKTTAKAAKRPARKAAAKKG